MAKINLTNMSKVDRGKAPQYVDVVLELSGFLFSPLRFPIFLFKLLDVFKRQK